jgi:hypothetical protein
MVILLLYLLTYCQVRVKGGSDVYEPQPEYKYLYTPALVQVTALGLSILAFNSVLVLSNFNASFKTIA